MSDLEMAVKTLAAKKQKYDEFWDYYDGDQDLVFNATKLREIFSGIDARFTENWCGVVIDSALDRLTLERFNVANDKKNTERLNQLFTGTELSLDADDAHLAALVTGEAFIVAWREEGGEVEAHYNDPRTCHIFYEPDDPRQKRFAVKWWTNGGYRYVNLYYPDQIEYYRSRNEVMDGENMSDESFMEIEGPATNPYGVIPVFHLRRERRKIRSELANVKEPQDSLNKLVSDMMVSAEFGAFRQRYAISQDNIKGKLKNAPNEIWTIPAGDGEGQQTTVGEFSATALDNYLKAIDQRANTIAVISRTPKHYFFSQSGDPSGESLIVQEGPLNKKVKRYISRFSATWQSVAQFLLLLDGVTVERSAIEPMFALPETIQPMTQATIRQTNVGAGMPLITVLKMEGWSEQDIEEMLKDAERMAASQQAGIGAAVLSEMEKLDKGGSEG